MHVKNNYTCSSSWMNFTLCNQNKWHFEPEATQQKINKNTLIMHFGGMQWKNIDPCVIWDYK